MEEGNKLNYALDNLQLTTQPEQHNAQNLKGNGVAASAGHPKFSGVGAPQAPAPGPDF